MEHYLDNSATTAVSKAAADTAYRVMTEAYGNPSSLHSKGMEAEAELKRTRKAVASKLKVSGEEVFFTSGGTEANNLALFGAAYANVRTRKKIIISSVEHSSVTEAAKRLEDEGFEVVRISPRSDGTVHAGDVAAAADTNTALVSVMLVNNETGAVMPVADIFAAVKEKDGKILCHEKKLRPGTENLPAIAALGAACDEFDIEGNYEKTLALNAYAKEKLLAIDGVELNSPENALPYVLNISAGRVRSETMLHFLEERDVFVSSGSACAKGKPSHVLSALGLGRERADSALRISFSKHNTKDDIDALCEGIALGLKVLAHR